MSVVRVVTPPVGGEGDRYDEEDHNQRENKYHSHETGYGAENAAEETAGGLRRRGDVAWARRPIIIGQGTRREAGRRLLFRGGRVNPVIAGVPGEERFQQRPDGQIKITRVEAVPEIRVQVNIDHIVVKCPRETRADRKPRLVFFGGQQEQHTVVGGCGTYAPVVKQLHGIFVGVHAVQVLDGDDDYLRAVAQRLQAVDVGV
jgi:hypothetical protein